MRFKKVPVSAVEMGDAELAVLVDALPVRNFAQSMEELDEHVFVAVNLFKKYGNYIAIHSVMLVTKPDYREAKGLTLQEITPEILFHDCRQQ